MVTSKKIDFLLPCNPLTIDIPSAQWRMQSAQLRREGRATRAISTLKITVRPIEDEKFAVFSFSITYKQLRAMFIARHILPELHQHLQLFYDTVNSGFCRCKIDISAPVGVPITTKTVDGLRFKSIREMISGLFHLINAIPVTQFVPIVLVTDDSTAYVGHVDTMLTEVRYMQQRYVPDLSSIFAHAGLVGICGRFYKPPRGEHFTIADIEDFHNYFTHGEKVVYALLAKVFGRGGRGFEKGLLRKIIHMAGWKSEPADYPRHVKFTYTDLNQVGGLVYIKNPV